MEKIRLIIVATMIFVIVASTFAYLQFNVQADANTATPPPFPPGFTPKFTYTVKFLCNLGTNPSDAQTIGLEPGFYQTDINIHNPSFRQSSATIVKKFILALPEDVGPPPAIQTVPAVPPPPYVLRWAILSPDAAMRLDCKEIISLLSTAPAPLTVAKGFVMIYSATNLLDVWAEYTTQATLGTAATPLIAAPAIDIVRVQPEPFVL